MISNTLFSQIQMMVRGALCAECKQPMTDGAVFFSDDTTRRTVHWKCRTLEDDPKKFGADPVSSEPQKNNPPKISRMAAFLGKLQAGTPSPEDGKR